MQTIAFACKDLHVENHRTSERFGNVCSLELHLRSHREDIRVAASGVRAGGAIESGVNIVELKLGVTDIPTVNIRWIAVTRDGKGHQIIGAMAIPHRADLPKRKQFVRRHFRCPATRPGS